MNPLPRTKDATRRTAARARAAVAAGLVAVLALTWQPACLHAYQGSLSAPPYVPPDPADLLPFARNEIPPAFPAIGVGVGFGKYVSDFASVEKAFHTIEDAYRAGGFGVPAAADVNLGPMVLGTVQARLNRGLDVAIQAGLASSTFDEVRLLGGLVSGRTTLPSARSISLAAGVGAGRCGFTFNRSYGVQVTPTDANGGYYRLDAIKLEGGGNYWTAAGTLAFQAGPRGAFEVQLQGQYFWMKDVTTDATRSGPVSVNLSGALLGAAFTIYF